MSTMTATNKTLAQTLWQSDKTISRNIILAIVGSLVLWVSAKINIPFWPVPQTMQTLVVLMVGLAFGSRLGVATILLYLAEGAVGLPVFAGTPEKGIGIAYMFGPTGGYLIGFVIAAGVIGLLAERGWDRNPISTIGAMMIGTLLIFVPGLLWLGSVVGWDKPLLAWGLTPFLFGAVAKIAIAAVLMPVIWKLLKSKA